MSDSLLYYNQETELWEGEGGERRVSMNHETFLSYVVVWVKNKMRIEIPVREQIALGVEHCRKMSYWKDCEKNYDPKVKINKIGGGSMKKSVALLRLKEG